MFGVGSGRRRREWDDWEGRIRPMTEHDEAEHVCTWRCGLWLMVPILLLLMFALVIVEARR